MAPENPDPQDPIRHLQERIDAARQISESSGEEAQKPSKTSGNRGIEAGMELLGGIGGGALIGLLLDRWLDTAPAFLIVFCLLGSAAGFWAAWKISQGIGTGVGFSGLRNGKKDAKTPDRQRLE